MIAPCSTPARVLCVAASLAAAPLGADVLVEYKFDDNATIYDPVVNASNLSAGDFTPGPGVNASQMDTTSALSVSGRSLFIDNAGFNQTTEGGAVSNNDSLSFTVTVAPGFRVDLTSLDFSTLRQASEGAGAPSAFSVYSSADAFATPLGSGFIDTTGGTTFTAQSVDLTSLDDLSGSIEFRIVFWAGDGIAGPSERRWRLDELILDGVVEAGAAAGILVEYKFDDNATIYDPLVSGSNLSAGDFTPGPGANASQMDTTSALSVSGRSLFIDNGSFNQTSEGGAFSNNDYLSFTVTVAPGFRVDLTSLDFSTLRQTGEGAGAPSAFSVYSSADVFATPLGSGFIDTTGGTTFTAQSVDLTSLEDLSGPIEFRIVFWAGDGIAGPSERRWRLDELGLTGVVEAGAADGTLVEYKFDDNATVYDPNVVVSVLSAGEFTPGPGATATQMNTTSALKVSGRSLFINNAGFNQQSEAGAVDNNDFVSFELTVDPGFRVDPGRLDFFTLRQTIGGGGAPSAFSVYSSADAFAAPLGSGTILAVGNTTFTPQSVDLSSLQNLTGTTEFRIILWAGDGLGDGPSDREWRLDELSLVGAVDVIPESPGGFSLTITPNTSNPGNYDFTWDSQTAGKVYDLVSETSLATAAAAWPVWDARANVPSEGTTTSLTNVPGGGNSERFFAVVERDAP